MPHAWIGLLLVLVLAVALGEPPNFPDAEA
jgi:hypothetical protein